MGAPRKLLIVDDDPVIRKYISIATNDLGFDIAEASDGLAALKTYREWQPDVVVLDNMLPGEMNGLEVCQEIRQGTPSKDPYIIIVSSCGDAADIEDGLAAGADEYLVKPVNPALIQKLLSNNCKSGATNADMAVPVMSGSNDDNPSRIHSMEGSHATRKSLLLVLLATISVVELLIMTALAFSQALPWWIEAVIDAGLLLILSYPAVHYFVVKPMQKQLVQMANLQQDLQLTSTAFHTSEAIMVTDSAGRIIRVNRAFERMTGYIEAEVKGENPRILKSGRHPKEFYTQMWDRLLATGKWRGEMWDRRKNGSVYPKEVSINSIRDSNNKVTHFIGVFKDISARKKTEDELYTLAYYDSLTGLPNRRMLVGQLNIARSASRASKCYCAMLIIGIDQFKLLNDTMSHHFGDLMLLEIKQRLNYLLPEGGLLGRLAGDEFAILLDRIGSDVDGASERVWALARTISETMGVPYMLDSIMLHKTSSIGCAVFLGDETSAEELIKRAEIALRHAKSNGFGKISMFDPEMQIKLEYRTSMEADLRFAITRGELQLYYQMQTDVQKRVVGAEALIRWNHPKRGIVPPGEFIPVAEQNSLIIEIGNWVLNTACAKLAEWAKIPRLRHLVLAINVSARQFTQSNFIEQVQEAISLHGIVPSKLKLEITESVSLEDIDYVSSKIRTLQNTLGVLVSLDDFGTGYSSLSYLKRLPFNQIKIDQSFVREVSHNPSDAIMIKTIIDMANNFNYEVIAEGVETESQLEFLKQHGCTNYQGYLFGKPVPEKEFEQMIPELPHIASATELESILPAHTNG